MTGHRRQIPQQGFATERDAVAAFNIALSELGATAPTVLAASSGVTLRDYLAEWLDRQRPHT